MRGLQLIVTTACAVVVLGQTRVDLKSQSKRVDFSGYATTPFETGAVLPATCTPGQMFFSTAASSGQNVFGCVSTNTWLEQAGTGGIPSIQSDGVAVGARAVLNFIPGPGVTHAISDTGQTIAIQSSVDSAVLQTRPGEQSGSSLLCTSNTASPTAYACALSPALGVYTTGMVLHWNPDVDGTGGPTTLNVDALGDVPVRLADGVGDPAPGDIRGGTLLSLWYDGTVFRWMERTVEPGVFGESRPACDTSVRGRLWFVAGTTGVADTFSLCARDSAGVFAWRTIY